MPDGPSTTVSYLDSPWKDQIEKILSEPIKLLNILEDKTELPIPVYSGMVLGLEKIKDTAFTFKTQWLLDAATEIMRKIEKRLHELSPLTAC